MRASTASAPTRWWRATPRGERLARLATLGAIGLLVVVVVKVWEGPGIHPTVHRLITQWGMVGFSVLAVVSTVWQVGALRRMPPAADPSRFWWAWAGAALAVGAAGWLLVQLVNAPIGEPACVTIDGDVGICNPNSVRVWLIAGLAVGAGLVGMALAVLGAVALAGQRAPIGTLIGPIIVFAGVAAAELPMVLIMYALASSIPPVVLDMWTVLGVAAGLALAVELLAFWWFVRRARTRAVSERR